jgi:cytochrome P450
MRPRPPEDPASLTTSRQLLTYPLTTIIYNLFFHPLRHFPGPLLHRASALPWALQHALGTSAFHTEKFHARYGPVVRIAPNHLSFTDPAAWRDIYGPLPRPGMAGSSVWPEMPKSKVFTSATDDQPESIIQAGFHDHARMRKALAPGFGEPALRRQEPVIKGYLDMLVAKLHQQCESDEGRSVPVNMEKWFNWTTFDIGGELVFGRMFRCLEKEEYHPWIAFIMGTLKAAAAMVSIIYLGGRWLVRILFNTVGQKSILTLREMTEEMVGQRLAMEKGRDDLFEGLVKLREEGVSTTPCDGINGLGTLTITPATELLLREILLQRPGPDSGWVGNTGDNALRSDLSPP